MINVKLSLCDIYLLSFIHLLNLDNDKGDVIFILCVTYICSLGDGLWAWIQMHFGQEGN